MTNSNPPTVARWLSRMPDSIALWILAGIAALGVEVAVLHVQLDDVREDVSEIKAALMPPPQPAGTRAGTLAER